MPKYLRGIKKDHRTDLKAAGQVETRNQPEQISSAAPAPAPHRHWFIGGTCECGMTIADRMSKK